MPLTTNIAESSNIRQQKNSSSNIFLHSLTVALNLTIQETIVRYDTDDFNIEINKFIQHKHIVDIKFATNSSLCALIMYEDL